MKQRTLEMLESWLQQLETDQKTGFDEGIYDEEETEEIRNLRAFISEYKKHRPSVYVKVEGGLVREAWADDEAGFEVFDVDLAKDDPDYIATHGTTQEWDAWVEKEMEEERLEKVY